jgi:hypothetical protein
VGRIDPETSLDQRPPIMFCPNISSKNIQLILLKWAEVIESVQKLALASHFSWNERHFYIVVFRSRIPPTTHYEDLGVLDKAAHEEATQSGGFLK